MGTNRDLKRFLENNAGGGGTRTLKNTVYEFIECKEEEEDTNTAHLYSLTMEEMMAIIGDIEMNHLDRVKYITVVSQIRKNSKNEEDILNVNMAILNEFVDWAFEEGYIECDLAYTYKLCCN